MPWPVDPELCEEGDIPFRINNFFNSGDMEAADVMLNAAFEAYELGLSWQDVIVAATTAEKQWRNNEIFVSKI
jgi:hypothetical protein